jgi:uncharacterized protein (TIGR02246 family)
MTPFEYDEVAAAARQWAAAFALQQPDEIAALYDAEAILWGTTSAVRRDGTAAIRDYFAGAFAALPQRKAIFGDQRIRRYGDVAINTGSYTISYVVDDEARSFPARYSFVYVKRGPGWLIVDHHSSILPGAFP